MSTRFSAEDESFIVNNWPQYGPTYCSKVLNRSSGSVTNKARKMKLTRSTNKSKHPSLCKNFDLSILESPTKELAYFLGFLWADGCILNGLSNKGSAYHTICFEIVSEDFDDIHSVFKGFSTWSIYNRKRCESWKETTRAAINNKFLWEFLFSLGYRDKNSSFQKVFNFLSPHGFIDYFILGLFDGDGYTNFYNTLTITGPIDFDWSPISSLLKNANVSFGIYDYSHPEKGHSSRKISIQNKSGVQWFYQRFLSDNLTFGLKRKRVPKTPIKV